MPDEQKIKQDIGQYLESVHGPDGINLQQSGRIQEWKFACGRVKVDVLSKGLDIPEKRAIDATLYEGLSKIDGVDDVLINMVNPDAISEVPPPPQQPPQRQAPGADQRTATGLPQKKRVPGVKYVIAIASGKGGVGKSTVAVNLAIALQRLGRKVGILDADCYGPSMPTMLGISPDEQPELTADRKVKPIRKWDLDVMSIGFFVEPDNAIIWRGLMVTKALQQFFFEVAWDGLDYLVIDLPPGTGDTQLTMVQGIEVDGAIIVSTPQDVALADARKGLAMFRETKVPVVGLIENMSYFECPHCGERTEIFAHGGARKAAEKMQTPFLGEIPLVTTLRESSDAGTPLLASDDDSPTHRAFMKVAEEVLKLTIADDKVERELATKSSGS